MTCSHEFWLLAFARVTYHRVTVLSHRPVRLRFLSFLWKVPLRLVRVSWLEKRDKLACLAACTCRKPVPRTPDHCFLVLFSLTSRHGSQIQSTTLQ